MDQVTTRMAGAIRGRRHTKGVLCVIQERFKPLFDSAVDAFMFLDQVGPLLSSPPSFVTICTGCSVNPSLMGALTCSHTQDLSGIISAVELQRGCKRLGACTVAALCL